MKSTPEAKIKSAPRGRPRKFGEPSKPITVRLPERVLGILNALDPDRARAIAKLAHAHVNTDGQGAARPVRLIEFEPGHALIVVRPSAMLRRIPWLRLVEIAPASSILVLPMGMSLENLEIEIVELLESLAAAHESERPLLEELRALIADLRREKRMTKSEIILVDVAFRDQCTASNCHSRIARMTQNLLPSLAILAPLAVWCRIGSWLDTVAADGALNLLAPLTSF